MFGKTGFFGHRGERRIGLSFENTVIDRERTGAGNALQTACVQTERVVDGASNDPFAPADRERVEALVAVRVARIGPIHIEINMGLLREQRESRTSIHQGDIVDARASRAQLECRPARC